MSAATILFTDIVGFSRKPTTLQRNTINGLNDEMLGDIRLLLTPPCTSPRMVALPTGDGAALVFLHDGANPLDPNVLFHLIVRMQQWAAGRGVQLRIGVHVGAISFITDINGRSNVCGDTINYAQRVMDASNDCQVLFSESAFREYVNDPTCRLSGSPFPDHTTAKFSEPIDVFAKHGLRIPVYILELWDESSGKAAPFSWWSNQPPKAKDWMLVSLTPLPKDVAGDFGKRFAAATRIALIQLTGDRLLERLRTQEGAASPEQQLSPRLERIWVFMPDPDSYAAVAHSPAHPRQESIAKCVEQWREHLARIRDDHPAAEVKLGLFQEPAFLGASFLDWDRPDGRIHVSAYVWNVAASQCPGYDLIWLGKTPSPVYDTYVRGLDYLHATTVNELDPKSISSEGVKQIV